MATRAYMPRYGNGSNTREMSRYHSSRGEEVSSPRVGLTPRLLGVLALATPSLRYLFLCLVCRFRY